MLSFLLSQPRACRRTPSVPHNLPGWVVRCPWFELQLFKLHRDD